MNDIITMRVLFPFRPLFAVLSSLILTDVLSNPLYPYGSHVNDFSTPHPERNHYGIRTGVSLNIFASLLPVTIQHHGYLILSNQSLASFIDKPRPFPIPGYIMIAPYWSEISLPQSQSGSVYYRHVTEGPELANATDQIRSSFGTAYQNFTANSVLIITYDKVLSSTHFKTGANTFQTVLITNGKETFAQFNYEQLRWPNDTSSQALMGFNIGDGHNFYSHGASLTRDILHLQTTSNVHTPGRWMFRIDITNIREHRICTDENCLNGECQLDGMCLCKPGWIGGKCNIAYEDCSSETVCKQEQRNIPFLTLLSTITTKQPELVSGSLPVSMPNRSITSESATPITETPISDFTFDQLTTDGVSDATDVLNETTIITEVSTNLSPTFTVAPSCDDDPCVNGNCTEPNGTVVCECFSGYTGVFCEFEIDECSSDPCIHGYCEDLLNGYWCNCSDGYAGVHCGIDINECASDPCMNGGSCVDLIANYMCICPRGYIGKNCENVTCIQDAMVLVYQTEDRCRSNCELIDYQLTDLDNCLLSSCLWGDASNTINYKNNECEILRCFGDGNLDNVCNLPATEGRAVYTYLEQRPCEGLDCGQGECKYDIQSKETTCVCDPGYSGINCKTKIDPCSGGVTCKNGGTCQPTYDGSSFYICLCPSGYFGSRCESEVPSKLYSYVSLFTIKNQNFSASLTNQSSSEYQELTGRLTNLFEQEFGTRSILVTGTTFSNDSGMVRTDVELGYNEPGSARDVEELTKAALRDSEFEVDSNNITIVTEVQLFGCDFETDVCGITESPLYSVLAWTRQFGASPRAETGPSVSGYGDYYALVNTVNASYGDESVQKLDQTEAYLHYRGDVCIQFKYYMYGASMGSLRLFKTVVGKPPHDGQLLWREASYSHNDWQSAYIMTTIGPEYEIYFVFQAGNGHLSDMAIDNIEINVDLSACEANLADPCSPYWMSTSDLGCIQKTWQQSCLDTGEGFPETTESTTAQYATLTTVNGLWWRVRYLSESANDGDPESIRFCYGTYSDYIRLAEGSNSYSGRVEVYYSGQWGTVCDDGFDDVDANVICKQLGHYTGVARTSAYFGPGSGAIVMKSVQCHRNNTNLYECKKRDLKDGRWQCDHKEDSGVICIPEPGAEYTIGADVVERHENDSTIGAVFIPSLQRTMPTAGQVTKWKIYNADPNQQIVLQVWRFIRTDIEVEYQEMYTLVNETDVSTSCTPKRGIMECLLSEPFDVEANDVIGFYFKDRNPIPFSVTKCYGRSEQLRYINNVRDPVFSQAEYGFSLAAYANNPCREYSIQVTVENVEPPPITTTEAPPADIILPEGALFGCSFEGIESDWCDLDPNDGWNKSRGATAFPETGPMSAYDGDVFVYQTAREDGRSIRLDTPELSPVNGTEACLTFFFSMIGEGISRLMVRQDDAVIYILEKHLSNGRQWAYFQYDVNLKNDTKFSFETVGLPPLSDVALDRIVLYNTPCGNMTDPPPVTTPPPTTPPGGHQLDLTPGTYYVNPANGNDFDKCGSRDSPCRTISYVFSKSSAVNILYLNATDTPYELNLDDVKKTKVELSLLSLSPAELRVVGTDQKMDYENVYYKYVFENLTITGNMHFPCPEQAGLMLTLRNIHMIREPGIVQVLDCKSVEVSVTDSVFDGVYMEFTGKDTAFVFHNVSMTNTIGEQVRQAHSTGIFFNLIDNEGSHTIEITDSFFLGLGVMASDVGTRRPIGALSIDTFDTLTDVKLFITNSVFSDNKRAIDVAMKGQNNVQVTGCTFTNNVGDGAGGAIRIASHMDPGVGESAEVRKPSVHISNCRFFSNLAQDSESYKEEDVYYKLWAPGSGGAVYIYVMPRSPLKVDGYVEIEGCTFVNNTGTANGGTIFVSPVILTSVTNCTIENAKTTDMPRARMGDVFFGSSAMSFENVTVAVNTAEESNPIFYYQASDLLNDKLSVSALTLTCAKGFDIDQTSTTFANGLQSLQLYCTPCGADHYSLDTSTVIVDNTGSFTDERISCYKCPYGADCSNGIANMDNFWGDVDDNSSEVSMYLCPEDYCVENTSIHIQFSSCVEHRQGVLCGRCEQGFSEALYGTACVSDDQCGISQPASIGLLVLVLVRGIIFVALLLFAEEWESVVNGALEKVSPKGKAEQIQMVTNEGFLTIYFYFIQTVELLQVDIIIEPDETRRIIRAEDVLPEIFLEGVDIGEEIQAASCFVPGITPVEKVALSFVYPAYAFLLLLLVYLGTGLCCICRRAADKPRIMRGGTARIMLVLLELFLFTYQGIAESILQLIQCVTVQGRSVLWIDGNVECLQTWQYVVIAITCIFVCPFFVILLFGPKVLKEKKITLGFFFLSLVLPVFCFIPIMLVFFGVIDKMPPMNNKKKKYSIKDLEEKLSHGNEKYRHFRDSTYKYPSHTQSPDSSGCITDVEDEEDLRESVADALVGTYRSWGEDGNDFLGGVCWEGVLNLQRLILVVVYIFTPDVLLRQMLLCALMFFILLLQMKLKPFSGRMSNRAQTAALSVIVMIGMFNLIRATLFHAGASPQEIAYVLVIILEWVEIVCTKFLPWLLILIAFLAVCAKGVKNKVDDSKSETAAESLDGSIGFCNDGFEQVDFSDQQRHRKTNNNRQPDGTACHGEMALGEESFDFDQFTAKTPDALPLPWRQKKYPVARHGSNVSETRFGRAPDLLPEEPTATNWKSLGFQ